jgi:hypothetical protein
MGDTILILEVRRHRHRRHRLDRGAFLAAIMVGLVDTLGRPSRSTSCGFPGAVAGRTVSLAIASMLTYLLMAIVLYAASRCFRRGDVEWLRPPDRDQGAPRSRTDTIVPVLLFSGAGAASPANLPARPLHPIMICHRGDRARSPGRLRR